LDTGTHFVMGIALGGLATLDPAVGGSFLTSEAVLVGTIIGSQAPDLDTVLKFKNNAAYLKNHRGITHSIPAVLLWSLLITGAIHFIMPSSSLIHVWIWTLLAVVLHVVVDIFNGYGTQALRPFSEKWIALGTINTFDSFIFIAHIVGIGIWLSGAHGGYTFLIIYCIIALYYVVRLLMQRSIKKKILNRWKNVENVIFNPTMKFRKWQLVIVTKEHYYVAYSNFTEIQIVDQFERKELPNHPAMEAAKKDRNISAFLHFSPVFHWQIKEQLDYTEIRLIDLRYFSKGHYPFVAVAQLDKDLNIVRSYTGWIFSKKRMKKKLKPLID